MNFNFKWDDETVKKAAELWNDGKSAAEIAVVLGVSRNAVIGITHRNKEIFKAKGNAAKGHKRGKGLATSKPRQSVQKKPKNWLDFRRTQGQNDENVVVSERVRETISKSDAEAYDAERLQSSKPLHFVEACMCKWPLNGEHPMMFCAAETKDTRANYCAHHERRAWRA